MILLLDANVILERALMRAQRTDVVELFSLATGDQLTVSRFSLHAVAFYMAPRNRNLHPAADAYPNRPESI